MSLPNIGLFSPDVTLLIKALVSSECWDPNLDSAVELILYLDCKESI